MSVVELKHELSYRGLPTTGPKEELVNRLKEDMEIEHSNTKANNESSPVTSKETGGVGEQELAEVGRKNETEGYFKQILAVMMEMKKAQQEKLEEVKANIIGVINNKMVVKAEKVENNEKRIGEIKQVIGEIKQIGEIEQEIGEIKQEIGEIKQENGEIEKKMDYFTKWPEAYQIPDQEATTVAEASVKNWISRFGTPLQLQSDQGRKFISAVCKERFKVKGIDKTQTTPLHPQSDGMVERFNRTIRNSLSHLVSKNQQDWDQKLPLFLLAYRSAVNETTGFTPSQLFNRDLRLPCDLVFGRHPDTPSSPEVYVENLQARIEDVHQFARGRINIATDKMKTRYDTEATRHKFNEADEVWFWNSHRRKGLSPKLQTSWEGPYRVLKRLNDVVVRIRKTANAKPRVVHYDRLTPYYGDIT